MNSFRNVKLLGWFNFCSEFQIYLAIAVIYFAQITGSYALALSIFSISKIASALFEIPTGIFSDLVGRKKTLIYGQIATILAITFYAIGGSFVVLVIGAILSGLSGSLFSGNNSALLYDTLKENGKEGKYAEFEGKNSSMFQFALGISAIFGSFVLGFGTFQYLFWLSLIPQFVGLIIAFKIIEPKKHFKKIQTNTLSHLGEAIRKLKGNPKLQKLSLVEIFDYGFGQCIKHLFLVFTGKIWAIWLVPFVKFFQHLLVAFGLRISVRIVKKFEEIKTAKWSYFGVAISSCLTTIISPFFMLLAGFFWGIWWVANSNMMQKEFTDSERATLGSITSFGSSIVFSILSVLFGMLADKYSPVFALTLVSICSLTVPMFYWKLK